MEADLCRCSFFLLVGVGGRACSNFLASSVVLKSYRGSHNNQGIFLKQGPLEALVPSQPEPGLSQKEAG